MTEPTYYTVADVAKLLDCHEGNVRRHHKEGTMPKGWHIFDPRKRLVFNRTEIDEWIPVRRKVGHPMTPGTRKYVVGSERNRFAGDDPIRDLA